MKKHTKAMFSLFLALCMLLSGLPWAPSVVAVEADNPPSVAIENEDAPLSNEITIVEEEISLRGEYEKSTSSCPTALIRRWSMTPLSTNWWTELG